MAFKLAIAFIISVMLQSILMSGILIYGGVLEQSRDNAYQIFSEKVNNRANNLEGEMENVWTNFEHYTNQISHYFTEQNATNRAQIKTTDERLEDLAPVVMDAMYYAKTTGAFLVLNEGRSEDDSHAALYFRNVNPSLNRDKNENIYLLAGPWSVSEKLQVVTDARWSYRLKLDESNSAFYERPFQSIGLADDNRLLGYWSAPFQVVPDGEEVITYSVPLTDENGIPIGVFGIEISLEYLYKYLPTTDLQAENSYGYLIGTRNAREENISATITHGALQKRMLGSSKSMELEMIDEKNQIYSIKNHTSKNGIYACASEMGMYYNNTPFADEEWYLIGLMEEPSLLEYPERIKKILVYSFSVSLIVGTLIAFIISRWFTKYSRLIELSEVPIGVFEMIARNNKVYMTNQVPKLLKLSKKQEHIFCKDKTAFKEYLKEFCKQKTDEDNVYETSSPVGRRWIRITVKINEETITGIVEDVTDEILQKRNLKKERDYDGLTGVKNRSAFNREAEEWNKQLAPGIQLCVIMFDLNGLKEINDAFGHNKGDDYICYAAKAIRSAFPVGTLFRIGGDEFSIILSEITEEKLKECKEKLGKQMDAYRECKKLDVGVAWGYAYYNSEIDQNFDQILFRADMNMYENKRKMKKRLQ